jgi:putative sigma-54 modulation protein
MSHGDQQMQTQFVFRHMDSSDAVRNYAEERLSKIKRYFSDPLKVSCVFSVEKINHIAQFDVTLRNGLTLHSSEQTESMYSSIDLALAKMERQVRRYKDRITNHKPHKGRAARVRQSVLSGETFEQVDSLSEADPRPTPTPVTEKPGEPAPRLVREQEFRAETLSVQDAIMQLNLAHRQFLVFTNTETADINVIYRMGDDYGLIETRGHVDDP